MSGQIDDNSNTVTISPHSLGVAIAPMSYDRHTDTGWVVEEVQVAIKTIRASIVASETSI